MKPLELLVKKKKRKEEEELSGADTERKENVVIEGNKECDKQE